MPATPAHIVAIAAGFALAGFAPLLPPPAAHAGDSSAAAREEAAKGLMRPVCANKAARDRVVAQMIEQGGEYERETSKWDMDVACEQIDLPVNPLHDTADPSDEASHKDWLYDARWSPDGKLIVTAGRDGSVRLWDVATGKSVRKIDLTKLPRAKTGTTKLPSLTKSDNPGHVRAARFLGDGKSIVVAADTHPIRIFDVATGEPIAEIPYAQPDPNWEVPPSIETTASGLVVLGGYGGDLVVYDTKTKAERYRLPGVPNEYPVFAVSETGAFLATIGPGDPRTASGPPKDRSISIQLRKLETGEPVWHTEAKGDASADSMAFSRDGKQLAVALRGQAYIYATADKKLINKVLVYPSFGHFEVAFTADGQRLIAGSRHAQLWDIATGKCLHHFGPFSDLCHSLDVSPDGKYLATGHMGSDGRVWEIDTGKFFRRLGKNVYPPG